MHTKLAVFATRFEELNLPDIQSTVPLPTYKLGVQYVFEKRITIRACDHTLTGTVEGEGEHQKQRLCIKGGSLEAHCSCASTERPLCRHTIAVLLEYQRQKVQGTGMQTNGRPAQPGPASTAAASSCPANPTLHEVLGFLDWMGRAIGSIERQDGVPEPAALPPGALMDWGLALVRLQDRFLHSEADRRMLESELIEHKKQLESVTRELQEREAAGEELRRELAGSRALQVQIDKERTVLADQLRSFLDATIIKKKVELESLSASARALTATLETLTPVESAHTHARAS